MKNEKGVTLIALIITIIVMLILVIVTINIVTSGGLIDKASEAKTNTQAATQNELNQMNTVANGIDVAVASATTEGIVYEISTVQQLRDIATQVNSGTKTYEGETIKLTTDLDFGATWTVDENGVGTLTSAEGTEWIPIGLFIEPEEGSTDIATAFKGTFDGQGHTITGMYINNTTTSLHQGLFGIASGSIKNITVKDSYIRGGQIGAIVGAAYSITITNCHNDSSEVYGFENDSGCFAGGIVGILAGSSTVINCTNSGDVTALNCYAAGICGASTDLFTSGINNTITNCTNTGVIIGTTTNDILNSADFDEN